MITNKVLKTELIEWNDLEWLQGNLKDIPENSFNKLKESIKTNNFLMPFNVWEQNSKVWVLDGHHRLKALQELEKEGNNIPKLLPANFIKCKNKKEASKLVLVYSSIYANVTEQGLTDFMFDSGLTIDDLGMVDLPSLDIDNFEVQGEDKVNDRIEDEEAIGNISSVFMLKDYAVFSSSNQLGIPDIKLEKCVGIPKDISVWNGLAKSEITEHYLHVHQNKSTVGLDPSKAVLAFYTHDSKFEKMWKQPAISTEKLLRVGWHSVVSANFSLWGYEPKIMRLISVFKARWLARYWQESGINIIPDVDWIDEKSFEYCLLGIPKGLPAVSIQAQTKLKDSKEREQRLDGINTILKELKPKQMLVYGARADKDKIENIITANGVEPIFVKSLLSFGGK